MSTLSPKFPRHIKPARPGVYLRNMPFLRGVRFSRWDGKHWRRHAHSIEAAARHITLSSYQGESFDPCWTWQGLAEEPKA